MCVCVCVCVCVKGDARSGGWVWGNTQSVSLSPNTGGAGVQARATSYRVGLEYY